MSDNFLWVEKYRPTTLKDCVLPDSTIKEIQTQLDSGEIQNLLFSGIQGSGKTTLSKCIVNDLGCDSLTINCSDERSIDLLRHKIKQFASTVSLSGGKKVVRMEEFDNTLVDFQSAFRSFSEEFSSNCRFIITCNYPQKIMPAIHSRFASYNFTVDNKTKPLLLKKFFDRMCYILNKENITYEPNVLAQFIAKKFPDFRKAINELQKYSMSNEGKIDEGIFASITYNFKDYIDALRNKDFKQARKWIAENDIEGGFYGLLYRELMNQLDTSTIPQMILIVADYQDKHSRAVDVELNMAALTVELLSTIKFKV